MSSAFDHSALEEEKKWISLSKKDTKNFQPLYSKYHAAIFRFIYRRTDDEMLAADLCSQTFYKALTKIKQFEWTEKPLAAWLYRIALNEIRKHYRDKKMVFLIEEDKIMDSTEIGDHWKNVNLEILTKLLNDMKEKDLQLIELKFFEGLTFREIAFSLDMKESAVKMKLYRLLAKLKGSIIERHAKI